MDVIRFLICATLLCAAFPCAGASASAERFAGRVIAVIDGDTLLVLRGRQPVKVRLAEIDAPEKAQPFGTAAQKSLAEMVKGREVQIDSRTVDDYGRLIADVHIGEINVNREQVRRGMAWECSRFHNNREMMALQREAQQVQRGLWAEEGAVEPSRWRKQHPDVFVAKQPADVSPPDSAPPAPAGSPDGGRDCSKKHCSEMSSCEEALRYLSICGKKALDGDTDEKPCERLCALQKKIKKAKGAT